MRVFYKFFASFLLFSLSAKCMAQEVSTLATVTANGGISIDAEGDLLVAHFGPINPVDPDIGKDIYKITPEGMVSLFIDGELNVGSGNAIDSNGFLYQSNLSTDVIYKIDSNGNIVDDNYASINSPVGIEIGDDNSLFVCNCIDNIVFKVSPDGTVSEFASSPLFSCVNGITKDNDGNFYTTNFFNGQVVKITPDGTTSPLGATPSGNGHLIFREADNMLYIACYSGHQVFKMDLSGNLELLAGTGTAGTLDSIDPLQATFIKPNGIALSINECSLYISQDDDVLREIQFIDDPCISGIENLIDYDAIKIYPNPATNFLQLVNESTLEFQTIRFVDVFGRTVQENTLSNDNYLDFDISSLSQGSYTILIHSELGEYLVYHFVKI